VVQAYIECPKGANNKYEFDDVSGCVKLDRVLHSAVFYPYAQPPGPPPPPPSGGHRTAPLGTHD